MKYFNMLLCLLLFAFLCSCTCLEPLTCPDGNTVNRVKKMKCAREFIDQSKSEFNAGISGVKYGLDKVGVELDSAFIRTKVIPLTEKLSNESFQVAKLLEGSWRAMVIDPCQTAVGHQRLMSVLSDKMVKLKELELEIAKANSATGTKGDLENAIDGFINDYHFENN